METILLGYLKKENLNDKNNQNDKYEDSMIVCLLFCGNLLQFSLKNYQMINTLPLIDHNNDSNIYSEPIKFLYKPKNDSTYLFTITNGNILKQWTYTKNPNAQQNQNFKLINNWGKIHNGTVHSIVTTPNKKYLFTSTSLSYLKQFCLSSFTMIKNYGKIHEGKVFSIETSADSEFLFTSDQYGY